MLRALFALDLDATKCNVTFDVGFGPVINAVTVTWCDLTLNCPAKRFKPNPIKSVEGCIKLDSKNEHFYVWTLQAVTSHRLVTFLNHASHSVKYDLISELYEVKEVQKKFK